MPKKICFFLVLIMAVSMLLAGAETKAEAVSALKGDLAVKSGSNSKGGGWDTQHDAVHEVYPGETLMLAATLKSESIADGLAGQGAYTPMDIFEDLTMGVWIKVPEGIVLPEDPGCYSLSFYGSMAGSAYYADKYAGILGAPMAPQDMPVPPFIADDYDAMPSDVQGEVPFVINDVDVAPGGSDAIIMFGFPQDTSIGMSLLSFAVIPTFSILVKDVRVAEDAQPGDTYTIESDLMTSFTVSPQVARRAAPGGERPELVFYPGEQDTAMDYKSLDGTDSTKGTAKEPISLTLLVTDGPKTGDGVHPAAWAALLLLAAAGMLAMLRRRRQEA